MGKGRHTYHSQMSDSQAPVWTEIHKSLIIMIIIIMYVYHVLINALSAHTIHINLNTIFYTHIDDSPTKTIYIRYYMDTHTCMHACTHPHTHVHAWTRAHAHLEAYNK